MEVSSRECLREQAQRELEQKDTAARQELEQAEKMAEEQVQAVLSYEDQMEGISIKKQVLKATGKELEGTVNHTLVLFQCLKMLKAAASEWKS